MRKKDKVDVKRVRKCIKKKWILENAKICENNKLNTTKIGKKVKAIKQVREYTKECFLFIINILGFLYRNWENWRRIYL